jgi:hypothetical protein
MCCSCSKGGVYCCWDPIPFRPGAPSGVLRSPIPDTTYMAESEDESWLRDDEDEEGVEGEGEERAFV